MGRLKIRQVVGLLCSFIIIASWLAPQGFAFAATVTVTANYNINIRSAPDDTASIVGYFLSGATATGVGRDSPVNWLLIDYNGLQGWVARWLCTTAGDLNSLPVVDPGGAPPPTPSSTPPPAPPDGSVIATASNSLNVRTGPGTNYGAIGVFPAGSTAPVIGRNSGNTWLFIDLGGLQGWVAAWLCVISGDLNTVPVTAPSGSSSAPVSGFLGGQVNGYISRADLMHSAHMTWSKVQVLWYPGLDPIVTADLINSAHQNGFKVMLSIAGPLYPSSIDFASYSGFVGGVAMLGADAIEVWNEMNLNRQWPAGQIDPASYVNNMLKPAYQSIKAYNPNTMVIAGALAPTGANDGYNVWADDIYLVGMRDAGAAFYMDCLGLHYNAGATSPDVSYGHPADPGAGHYSWYYKPTFDLYSGVFSSKKLCYTELGYVSPEGYPPLPPTFWWGSDTSVAEQSAWLGRAVTLARTSGRVQMVIVFNVDFWQYGDDPQGGYAILRPDGSCPACAALAAAVP